MIISCLTVAPPAGGNEDCLRHQELVWFKIFTDNDSVYTAKSVNPVYSKVTNILKIYWNMFDILYQRFSSQVQTEFVFFLSKFDPFRENSVIIK